MSVFKNRIKSILSLADYAFVRKEFIRPMDLRNVCNSPRAINYYSYHQQIIIESSPEMGRGRPLFTFSKSGVHPFVVAANSYLEKKTFESIYEVLEKYYDLVQPKNASEIFNFPIRYNSPLNKIPVWSIVMPWDIRTPETQVKHIEKVVKDENKQAGADCSVEDGWAWTGPANPNKIQIESDRLKKLLDSVKLKGYLRHNGRGGDIAVYIFMKNNKEWCWQAKTGQHRATAVSIFDYEKIAFRVLKVINREDAELWPNVANGIYTKEEALDAFDQIFAGGIPATADRWIEYVNSIK
jgi:hypothetical protein